MFFIKYIDKSAYKYHETCVWFKTPCERLDISI